ncbi:MAG: HPr family phosphocarrier protein [Mycetocola sp.]
MSSRTATIASAQGLHARPAGIFIQAVQQAGVPVTIGREGGPAVDASSILMLMGLGLSAGDTVVLSTNAEDADAVLSTLVDVLETDHDAA